MSLRVLLVHAAPKIKSYIKHREMLPLSFIQCWFSAGPLWFWQAGFGFNGMNTISVHIVPLTKILYVAVCSGFRGQSASRNVTRNDCFSPVWRLEKLELGAAYRCHVQVATWLRFSNVLRCEGVLHYTVELLIVNIFWTSSVSTITRSKFLLLIWLLLTDILPERP